MKINIDAQMQCHIGKESGLDERWMSSSIQIPIAAFMKFAR